MRLSPRPPPRHRPAIRGQARHGMGNGGIVTNLDSTRSLAHRAGLLYVLASSLAPFAYLYVPGALIVRGDALATAERVRAAENLLRAGIVAELYGVTILLFASVAL